MVNAEKIEVNRAHPEEMHLWRFDRGFKLQKNFVSAKQLERNAVRFNLETAVGQV